MKKNNVVYRPERKSLKAVGQPARQNAFSLAIIRNPVIARKSIPTALQSFK